MEVVSKERLDMDNIVDASIRDFFENKYDSNKSTGENIKNLKSTIRSCGAVIVTRSQIQNVFSKVIIGQSMMKIDSFEKAVEQSEKMKSFIYTEFGVK